MTAQFARVEHALKELQQGKMIILTDDPDRENEGDLIFPAEKITPGIIQFMIRYCSGIICLALPPAHVDKLNLSLMVAVGDNTSQRGTPFTVSIEAKEGVTTGVSAADRARTILAAVSDTAKPEDLVKPGHVFPLQAKHGGVLERAGHTEGSLDLVSLAGFKSAAVLCEIMNPDGSMAKGNQLREFAEKHQLTMLAMDDLIAYRLSHESLIEESISTILPMAAYGNFKLSIIKEKLNDKEHLVLESENIKPGPSLLLRIHSACMTGDLFASQRCDCHQQLHYSLERISKEGGMLIYLNQEGRGIGLLNKIKAYALQDKGADTIEANQQLGLPADLRKYYIVANILRQWNIQQVRLLTNNPHKIEDLKKYGVLDVERVAMPVFSNCHNQNYLKTKQTKLNHFINTELFAKESCS